MTSNSSESAQALEVRDYQRQPPLKKAIIHLNYANKSTKPKACGLEQALYRSQSRLRSYNKPLQ